MPPGKNVQSTDLSIPTEEGMQELNMADFLYAVKSKDPQKISCKVEDAFASTATVKLAAIAYYYGSKVKWHKRNKTVIDNPESARLLKRVYREKWQHPGEA